MRYSDYVDDFNVGADTLEEIDVYVGKIVKDGTSFAYNGTVS